MWASQWPFGSVSLAEVEKRFGKVNKVLEEMKKDQATMAITAVVSGKGGDKVAKAGKSGPSLVD